ncbi:MAG: hypothetical protein JNK40_01795 [Chromatiales bacterium]|nr:hypothetical protein [Chromatiales bacterium]
MLDQIAPQNYRERAGRRAQLLCNTVANRWLSKDVEEYEQRTWFVAVDRQQYDDCLAEELPKAKIAELKALALKSLKVVTLVLVPVIACVILWYRRPLFRQARNMLQRVGRFGAD